MIDRWRTTREVTRCLDGTTHVVFEPMPLVEMLAAIEPPPRMHTVRYHGVLARRSAIRKSILAKPRASLRFPRAVLCSIIVYS